MLSAAQRNIEKNQRNHQAESEMEVEDKELQPV
jgi:hypothetical protein